MVVRARKWRTKSFANINYNMEGTLIIFILTLVTYIPLAIVLLYVWWKYGRNEIGVSIARTVYLVGSAAIIFYMMLV